MRGTLKWIIGIILGLAAAFVLAWIGAAAWVLSPNHQYAHHTVRRYTEADVHAFVKPAVTRRADLLTRFGQPVYVENHPKYDDGIAREDEILYFPIDTPPDAVNGRHGFSGFSVGIKDGLATDVHISTGTVYKH